MDVPNTAINGPRELLYEPFSRPTDFSRLRGKTDITGLTMSVSGKSTGFIGVACSGSLVGQDGTTAGSGSQSRVPFEDE